MPSLSARCISAGSLTLAWVLVSTSPLVRAGVKNAVLVPDQTTACFFGGAEASLTFTLAAVEESKLRVTWQLTTLEKRPLAQGEETLPAASRKVQRLRIALKLPLVKAGVILPVMLHVQVAAGPAAKVTAAYEKPLWIFPLDPFAERTQWLKELGISLFDPDGKTSEILTKLGVPFELTRNVAELGDIARGIIVIAEGLSFQDYRELPDVLAKAAARNVPVLCLAPSAGTMALPLGGPSLPTRVSFRQHDAITALDKRFDAAGWGADAGIVAGRIAVKAVDDQVVGEVQQGREGWPWLEIDFAHKGSKLIVCGFGIMQHWDANPTPRFMLAALLEYLQGKNRGTQVKEP